MNEAASHPQDHEVWIDGYGTGTLVWSCYGYSTGGEYENIIVDLSDFSGNHTICFVDLTSEQRYIDTTFYSSIFLFSCIALFIRF